MFGSGSSDSDDEDVKRHCDVEWSRMREARLKEGFRDGLAQGEEETLQLGFDEGYRENITSHVKISYLKGVLSALTAYHELQGEKYLDGETLKKIKSLESDISAFEQEIQKADTYEKTVEDRESLTYSVERDELESNAVEIESVTDTAAGASGEWTVARDDDEPADDTTHPPQEGVPTDPIEGAVASQTQTDITFDDIYKRCCEIHRTVLGTDLVISIPGAR